MNAAERAVLRDRIARARLEADAFEAFRTSPLRQGNRGLTPTVSPDDPPTARELEALEHVSEGLRNEAISIAMGCTFETAKSHLKSLSSKLGARNRAHLVTVGFRAAYLKLDVPS